MHLQKLLDAVSRIPGIGFLRVPLSALILASIPTLSFGQLGPSITSVSFSETGDLKIEATVPGGYRYALLEVIPEGGDPNAWQPLVSGPMTGASGTLTFTLPRQGAVALARLQTGTSQVVPPATYGGPNHLTIVYNNGGTLIPQVSKTVHTLNRVTYGPSPVDFNKVIDMGTTAYLNEQLDPNSIDESGNAALNDRIADLFHTYLPYGGDALLAAGSSCRFFRGTSEPPAIWLDKDFDDSAWEAGTTGVGYGDGDDTTVLEDMRFIEDPDGQPGYLTFYLRQEFEMTDLEDLDQILLRIIYDDAFIAYLNGTEIARSPNINGDRPPFDQPASATGGNVDNGGAQREWNITSFANLLEEGTNVLAVQIHNRSVTSSDSSGNPSIVNVSSTPYPAIRGVRELQHLLHVRGVYSERQLQAVLGEFWENHFTTDFDKLVDTLEDMDAFEDLIDAGVDEDLVDEQIETEAAAMEYAEYQFFYENALGNFGDLLLYSATSPTMLIYLDNILNEAGEPNENYSREILELHTRGADNGYTQLDIEELSRCFTGWTIRKIIPELQQPFPDSARTPPTTPSQTVDRDVPRVDAGAIWQVFKGTKEPSPGPEEEPTIEWTKPGFSTVNWTSSASGFGYGDGDDATVLSDMRQTNNQPGYASVYVRHEFTLDPTQFDNLILEIDYDDGYVAYLNGVEISRSPSMNNNSTPPAFDETSGSHESGNPRAIDLTPHLGLFHDGLEPNVLAIQAHNTNLTSSDLTLIPRILGRTYTEDSIAEADPNGIWAFRFDPDQHDTGEKILFDGAPEMITIPAGRTGADGINDALDVIDALVSHRKTAEFICVKLVNKFVSDEISLDTYQNATAPEWLLTTADNAIAAWESTAPQGNIETVMRAILDPENQQSGFWMTGAKQAKVKTPIEFINSGFRALEANITADTLPNRTEDMGMEYFQRNDPDGYDEKGVAWIDTLGLLSRTRFNQALGLDNNHSRSDWDIDATLDANGIRTPEALIDYFDNLLFFNELPEARRSVLLDYANTDETGALSRYTTLTGAQKRQRLRDLTGLILSTPEFQFQ